MTTRPAISVPAWPRGLSRELAARYVGISPSKFDELVKDGRMPPPREIDRRTIWCLREVDLAFDALPHKGHDVPEVNPWHE